MQADLVDAEFPHHGILPKKETEAWSFITKYPEFDGRGTIIAVLDNGIDPGAAGLQVTSTGQPKLIDIYDATGSGDVDTSTVVKVKDGIIEGLTGRKLKIPSDWTNPSGDYYVGVKDAYTLFPPGLITRIKAYRAEKLVSDKNVLLTKATVDQKEFSPTSNPLSNAETMRKDELSSRVKLINEINDKIEDTGPVYDCVVFHDGNTWRGVVDTSECGDLSSCDVLASYREQREYSRFSVVDMLNFGINIYDDGKLLEIVINCQHGTHVAGISAAFHEENSERNGVAPGAQLVSVKIADTRLGCNEETGSAFIRAMIRVIENKCDVVNISFGESARWANDGRVIDFMAECVKKHNILIFSSAGNNGPALTTVGCPGTSNNYIIGVGAFVSPEMMAAEYSMREKLPGTNYTWSSCGPASDGALGVSISAPGGAITSVPNWTLQGAQMMNGTSMSSPNCTGCVALVLSGLKQKGVPYTTVSTHRALVNTAKKVDGSDIFSVGYGLVQVDRMYEYLVKYGTCTDNSVLYHFSTYGPCSRGIYIREPSSFNKPNTDITCTISPEFVTNYPDMVLCSEDEQKCKIGFSKSVALTCTESWVQIPTHIELLNTSRSFLARVNHTTLTHGAHYAEIRGYDVSCIERGPLFRIPVTVCVPDAVSLDDDFTLKRNVTFNPGQKIRHFIHVPRGATNVMLTLKSNSDSRCVTVMHTVLLTPGRSYTAYENEAFCVFNGPDTKTECISVKENSTLEVCVARWWSNPGNANLDYEVKFHGVTTDCSTITMQSSRSVEQINVTSHLRKVLLEAPTASITQFVQPVRPSTSSLNLLTTTRDSLPNQRLIYALDLEYQFKTTKSSEVIPTFPLLCDILYESPFESQFWCLYDNNKRFIRSGDAYPVQYKYSSKLEAGSYMLKLRIRHEDKKLLEQIKKSPMELRFNTSCNLDLYPTQKQAIIDGRRFRNIPINKSEIQPLFISAPCDDKLTKLPMLPSVGSYLHGQLTLDINRDVKPKVPLRVTVMESCKVKDADVKTPTPPTQTDEEKKQKYEESVVSNRASWISKLSFGDGLDLYNKLTSEYQYEQMCVHINGLQTILKQINTMLNKKPESDGANTETKQEDPVKLVDLVTQLMDTSSKILDGDDIINKTTLLNYLGLSKDPSPDAQKTKTEMTKNRDQLIDIFIVHLNCMLDVLLAGETGLNLEDLHISLERVNTCWDELQKFTDKSHSKKLQATLVKYYRVNECYGSALQSVLDFEKQNPGSTSKEDHQMITQLLNKLGWTCIETYNENSTVIKYPSSYALF